MGDRANVVIQEENGKEIFLYTHWNGSGLPDVVRLALAKRERWNDPPYLARIVFCEMLKEDNDSLDGTTGFGISSYMCDNEHPLIVLDTNKQCVRYETENRTMLEEYTFEEYIGTLHYYPGEELNE